MKSFGAIDLFCGAGGLTVGLRRSGINVLAGVDIDGSCKFPVEANNPGTVFIQRGVECLPANELRARLKGCKIKVLAGCAPCQPFSKYTVRAGTDDRWRLLEEFLRLIQGVRPDAVSMENVPQLMRDKHPAYVQFVEGLSGLGYHVSCEVVRCSDFGVPQTRERLVLLAGAQGRRIQLLRPRQHRHLTVRAAIGSLPAIKAGEAHQRDPLHASCDLTTSNLTRIRATPEGGSWRDWPDNIRLACHKKPSGRFYGSVYGRMKWDDLAPTITTQCFGYGNGRFGHPEQDRAISLREAAILQTFPRAYRFSKAGENASFQQVGRHIGNAVPVRLAVWIGKSLIRAFA